MPLNVAPLLSTLLDEAQKPLGRAEEINALLPHSESKLGSKRCQFPANDMSVKPLTL